MLDESANSSESGNIGDNSGGQAATNDTLFRIENDTDKPSARADYEHEVSSSKHQVIEALQDSMRGLKTLMGAVLKANGRKASDLKDYEDAYSAENRMSSKNKAEADDYERTHMKPLLKEKSLAQVLNYLRVNNTHPPSA